MIEQIKIKHFKKLRDAELHFAPISLLIGGNNSAKSTVFKAFNFLKAFFNGQKDGEYTLKGEEYKTFDVSNMLSHSLRRLDNSNIGRREFSFEFVNGKNEKHLFVFGLPSSSRIGNTVVLNRIVVTDDLGIEVAIERSARGSLNTFYPNIQNIFNEVRSGINSVNAEGKTFIDLGDFGDSNYRFVQRDFINKIMGEYRIESQDGKIVQRRKDNGSEIFIGPESGFSFFGVNLKTEFPEDLKDQIKTVFLEYEKEVFELVLEEVNKGVKVKAGSDSLKGLRKHLTKLISDKVKYVKEYTKNKEIQSFFKDFNFRLKTIKSKKEIHYEYDSQVEYFCFINKNTEVLQEFHLFSFIETYFFYSLRGFRSNFQNVQGALRHSLNLSMNYIQIERNRDNPEFYSQAFHAELKAFHSEVNDYLLTGDGFYSRRHQSNTFRNYGRRSFSVFHGAFLKGIKSSKSFEETLSKMHKHLDRLSLEHFQKNIKVEFDNLDETEDLYRDLYYKHIVPFTLRKKISTKKTQREIKKLIDSFKEDYRKIWLDNNHKLKAYYFFLKWIGENGFDVADGINVSRSGEKFGLDLYKGREKIGLKDIGFGTSQLMGVLFKITQTLSEKSKGAQIMMEEPESNLHPDYQIKLAEMIWDYNKAFGLNFIIETHSEYMLREFQLMVKRGDEDFEQFTKDKFNVNFGVDGEFSNITLNDKGLLSESIAKNFYGKTAEQMKEFQILSKK